MEEHADTDFMHTETWLDWIILDAHRISKISDSFNPFTEKEAPSPHWPLSLFKQKSFWGELGGGGGSYLHLQSKCVQVCMHACVWVCAGDCECESVVFQYVLVWLCMTRCV